MSTLTLTKTRIQAGIYEGQLETSSKADEPKLEATHLGRALDGLTLDGDASKPGIWTVRLAIPSDLLSDGVQTIVISEASSEEVLDSFAIVAGEPLSEDLRAEVDLLRSELDMLKRAFRRHCNDSEP